MKKYSELITILIVVISILCIIFFSNFYKQDIKKDRLFAKAKVIAILEENLQEDPRTPGLFLGFQNLNLEILTGPYKGETYSVRNPMSAIYNVHAQQGMEVIAQIQMKNNEPYQVYVYNYNHEPILLLLTFLFFLLLALLGRLKGLKSILSLIFTGVMIVYVLFPLIFHGLNPTYVTIGTVSITAIVSLLLVGGYNKKTLSAILGTIAGVITAGILSYIAGKMTHLSGLTSEQAEELLQIARDTKLQVRGLMFSAILIASLGAIMDVAMSISSSIYEIHEKNQKLTRKELVLSGMNIGRDIMGTMSNTLILAFTGGALNTILLIVAYRMPYLQLINLDLIGTECIQGISGSIGLILTVPITTIISVAFIRK